MLLQVLLLFPMLLCLLFQVILFKNRYKTDAENYSDSSHIQKFNYNSNNNSNYNSNNSNNNSSNNTQNNSYYNNDNYDLINDSNYNNIDKINISQPRAFYSETDDDDGEVIYKVINSYKLLLLLL